jgi:hypothetical protein
MTVPNGEFVIFTITGFLNFPSFGILNAADHKFQASGPDSSIR